MLGQLPVFTNENVMVAADKSDDAGVYKLTDELAAVLTVDVFTPIVDDPYAYGAIAAANALSDVYAMGGRPLAALNIALAPAEPEFLPVLKEIMRGGLEKMKEAGVPVIGGHTVRDKEPKFGFAVMGTVRPGKIFDNTKGRAGDSIILTKPIGTGVISTGIRAGLHDKDAVEEFTMSMSALNRRAGELMLEHGASTATDITGFGLIGHLSEILLASGLKAGLHSGRVPYFAEALRLAAAGAIPGGTRANMRAYEPLIKWMPDVPEIHRVLMNDAQTSGGLAIFIPEDKRGALQKALRAEGITAAHIGDVSQAGAGEDIRFVVEL